MADPFWFGMPQPAPFDFEKVDYRVPTRVEYMRDNLRGGFDDIAWNVIELWEASPSRRAFKRALRRGNRGSHMPPSSRRA